MFYVSVNKSLFIDEFRSIRPDNFTYEGLSALYDYFNDMDGGEMVELDVIAICCEFSQYMTLQDCLDNTTCNTRDELEQNTIVIDCDDGSIIIQDF